MSASAGPRSLLKSLGSSDALTVRAAVESLGRALGEHVTLDDHDRVVRRLGSLAAHPASDVRLAVARAIRHAPAEVYYAALGRLLEDEHSLVRDAAKRTRALREDVARSDVLQEEHSELLAKWLSDIEAAYSPKAREAAASVAERYASLLLREAYHELNRALTASRSAVTELDRAFSAKTLRRPECRKRLDAVHTRLSHLTALIDGLHTLAVDVEPEFRIENLLEIVNEALDQVRASSAAESDLIVENEVAADLTLDGHRTRLVQALRNVFQNAAEAYAGLKKRPWVRIDAEAQGSQISLRVSDRGCGMTDDMARSAFRLFVTSKPRGTGFGLPLAKRIIENEHRGSIRLSTRKGEGTTITIVLPLEQELREP